MCAAYGSPEAETARLSLLRWVLGGWLLVFGVLEAGRLAHMRMVVAVAEPDIAREVLVISLGVSFKLSCRSNNAISFAKTERDAMIIGHSASRATNPAGVVARRTVL